MRNILIPMLFTVATHSTARRLSMTRYCSCKHAYEHPGGIIWPRSTPQKSQCVQDEAAERTPQHSANGAK
jgi:hypothetical protein